MLRQITATAPNASCVTPEGVSGRSLGQTVRSRVGGMPYISLSHHRQFSLPVNFLAPCRSVSRATPGNVTLGGMGILRTERIPDLAAAARRDDLGCFVFFQVHGSFTAA